MKDAHEGLPRLLSLAVVVLVVSGRVASAQGPTAVPSPTTVNFGVQSVGATTSSQTVTLTNTGSATLNINYVVLTGNFYGDFALVNNCGSSLPVGGNCPMNLTFAPGGTGVRSASMLIFDDALGSPQSVTLSGTGVGTCVNVPDCGYQVLNSRTSANQTSFFIYKDADSGFNHGFPSGFFGNIDLKGITVNAACIDAPTSVSGCTNDTTRFDGTRGTVFGLTLPAMSAEQFAGVNFQDPENYNLNGVVGNGYNLVPATMVQFDVRSPSGFSVQFGVGGCVTNLIPIPPTWITMTIPLDSLFPPPNSGATCPPDITATHVLFSISTNGAVSPNGGTVLLDNIQFTPAPARQLSDPLALSLPLSTQTFGVVPMLTIPTSGQYPLDQANRGLAAIYEESLTILSLLRRGQPTDVANAMEIAQALHYALYHDNHGDPLPTSPTNAFGCYSGAPATQCALHSAYPSGDIALLNNQPAPELGQAGDVRLAGFTGGCGTGSGFCLVLDGATGGNNAWGILAFAASYIQSGNTIYLTDAETIGNWIVANLLDPNQPPASLGGYFVGYSDQGLPKVLIQGKSTENNADIFAAFSLLAQIETARGNAVAAAQWTRYAKMAGDFVKTMFDPANGRFLAGTVTAADARNPGAGVRPDFSLVAGNDVANSYDFLDSNSFTVLAMAGSQAYRGALSWSSPVQFLLSCPVPTDAAACFVQAGTAGGNAFQGLDIVTAALSTGVTWEFTGQTDELCNYADDVLNVTTFQACAQTYIQQILNAQNQAPFGDGLGIVASVPQNGDVASLANQCVSTPFQCIPERVGLAATNWGIIAAEGFNPLAFPGATFLPASISFPSQLVGTSSAQQTATLTNVGTAPLVITSVGVSGPGGLDFQQQNNCPANTVLSPGATCTISLTFMPTFSGSRAATLMVVDNAFGGSQALQLVGTGQAVDDFSISVSPASQSIVAGNSVGYSINTALTMGNPQSVVLSVSGLPSCAVPTFSQNPINSGQTSALTINTTSACLPGTSSLAVTGTSTEAIHTAHATLMMNASATLSPTVLTFGSQAINTSSAQQTVVLSNGGQTAFSVSGIVLSGSFAGDFAQTNTCASMVIPSATCTISVTFTPTGIGTRQAILYVFDATGSSPQFVNLTGVGTGSCGSVTTCVLRELTQSATANQQNFFVYRNADSADNHGFPSGFFGTIPLNTMIVNAACVDDLTSASGCSADPTRIDGTRGTVFSLTFPPMSNLDDGGVNIQDPENYGLNGVVGNSYDLTGATAVQFDVRSPSGISVRFGMGNCTADFTTLPASKSYATTTVPISSFTTPGPGATCPPDISHTHILFTITTNGGQAPAGGTVLLDNIRYVPTPSRVSGVPSLPISSQAVGVVARQNYPIPVDQAVQNLSSTYEAALTAISLLRNGQAASALMIMQALHYALYHDNHGDPIPISLSNASGCVNGAANPQCGLHSGYEGGDLPLLNNQAPPKSGQAGDVRLSGFSAGTNLCGTSGFCLVLDGATGANNAWAMLAFEATYQKSGDRTYLADAETIGTWIVGNLKDSSTVSYGGYFLGYNDGGLPKVLILGKSTADNSVIYAALMGLAQVEAGVGNSGAASQWTNAANVAGDFVVKMFDAVNGRFYAGTLNSSSVGNTGPGVCPDLSLAAGNDVVNSCDFLASDSLSVLAMAAFQRYSGQLNWSRPLQYILTCPLPNSATCFTQMITADGTTLQGFDLLPASPATGSAWESTGQTTETCNYLDSILGGGIFQNCAQKYVSQLLQVQNSAPFGDGMGIVGATLPNGDTLPPLNECLSTPFVCVPERISLAATNWTLLTSQGFDPLGPIFSLSAGQANPASVNPGASSNITVTVTPNGYTGTVTLNCSISPVVSGANAPTCSFSSNPLSLTGTSSVSTTLMFTTVGPSAAMAQRPTPFYGRGQSFGATHRGSSTWYMLGLLPIPALALIGICLGSKGALRKKVFGFLLVWTMLAELSTIPGCGGSSNATCSVVPSAPGALQATSTTSSGTTLNWSASTVGTGCSLTNYTIYQTGVAIATTTSTSYSVTSLSPSTTYNFTVAASDSFGMSGQSPAINVTTLSSLMTPSGTYTISIVGKDANGIVLNGVGAVVSLTVN